MRDRLAKILTVTLMAAGVLAIASVDGLWEGLSAPATREEAHALRRTPGTRVWRPVHEQRVALDDPKVKPLQSALSRSLEQDELHEQNPFANLSNLDPLQSIFNKGVASFHREAFRSPNYRQESGYDMLSYQIVQNDGTKSLILAYLEKPDKQSDERVAFVVFMVAGADGQSHYTYYRGDLLVEQSDLTTAEAEAFVAQKLDGGIPFLSLDR